MRGPSTKPIMLEGNWGEARMVFIQDAVSGSKDSVQRRDLRFESGALLSSDRSLCDPDLPGTLATRQPLSSLRGQHTPMGRDAWHFPCVGSAFFP